MSGRLNSFQKTMLQWNDLHPYNAVHVVRIPAAFDLARLRRAIVGTLESQGLTGLIIDREKGTYRYQGGGAEPEVRLLSTGDGLQETLSKEIERQLNAAFTLTDGFLPFRFFTAPENAAACWLGLAYFHAVADAEAVVFLLHDIVQAYLGAPLGHNARLNLYPARTERLLRRPALAARKLLSVPAQVRNAQRSFRPPHKDPQDFRVGVTSFTLPRERLASLLEASKSWQVTVNDLLLALLIKAVSPSASARIRRPSGTTSRSAASSTSGRNLALSGAEPSGSSWVPLSSPTPRQTKWVCENSPRKSRCKPGRSRAKGSTWDQPWTWPWAGWRSLFSRRNAVKNSIKSTIPSGEA